MPGATGEQIQEKLSYCGEKEEAIVGLEMSQSCADRRVRWNLKALDWMGDQGFAKVPIFETRSAFPPETQFVLFA